MTDTGALDRTALGVPGGAPRSAGTSAAPGQTPKTRLELPVIRLQVQLGPIKPGRAPWREYNPVVLHRVSELAVTVEGAVGIDEDGTEHLDVHHRTHPASRDRKGLAGVSIMATGDYAALRARYGEHLIDGIAGESVLVEHEAGLAGRAMPPSMTLRRGAGDPAVRAAEQGRTDDALLLTGVHIAEPCVEFTRFCLRLPASDRVGDDVRDGLVDLSGGARGYKMVASRPWRIRIGDVLVIDL